jgi:hypothetical protein
MRTLISTVCAVTLVASTAVVPSMASPLVPQPSFEANNSLIQVGSKYRYYGKKDYRGKRRYNYKRHNNNNNNWWIPALIGGVIIGSALSQRRYSQPAGSCGYWSQRCSANWSRPADYRGCMRYYGCY